jgi:hypothetical protein
MNARGKPWEWNQKTSAQAQQFFGIAPGPPAALLRMPNAAPPQVQPQDLPQFAKGGVVTKPTIGILAEKEPEAVVPVRKLAATKVGRKIIRMLRAKRIDDSVVA